MAEYLTMSSSYAFFVQIIAASVGIVCVSNDFVRDVKRLLLLAAHALGVAACLYLADMAFSLLFSSVENVGSPHFFIASAIVYAAYTAVFAKYKWQVRIAVAFTLFTVLSIVIEIGGMFSYLLFAYCDSQLVRSLTLLLVVLYVAVAKVFRIDKYSDMSTSLFVAMIVCDAVVSAVAVSNMLVSMGISDPTWLNAVVMFALYVILVIIHIVSYYNIRERYNNLVLFAEKQLAAANADMRELLDAKTADMRRFRHDIKNQLSYMDLLLEGGKYGELKDYFDKLDLSFASLDNYVESGNTQVNSIINIEASKAAIKGIKINCNAAVPAELNIDSVRLCSLLTNLLDNAIEACVRYGIENPCVDFTIALRGAVLYVCVKNPIGSGADADKILRLNTTKANSEMHGFGTQIVRRIAEYYDGNANFSVSDGEFIAEVLLNIL